MAALDRFLRTLRGEQNVGDIASPGSWVQFFVAPAPVERLAWEREKAQSKSLAANKNKRGKRPVEKLILGSADAATEEYVPEWDPKFMETMDSQSYKYLWRDPNGVEIFRYQFGALAAGESESSLWLDFKKPSEEVLKKWEAVEKAREAKAVTSGNSTNDIGNVNIQEEKEEQDLWKDLETDTEIKITVPEFSFRTNIENQLYKGEIASRKPRNSNRKSNNSGGGC